MYRCLHSKEQLYLRFTCRTSSALLWLFHVLVALIFVCPSAITWDTQCGLWSLNPSARTHGCLQCGDLTGVQFWPTWAGRLFWEGVCQAPWFAPNLLLRVGSWRFSHQFPSDPFASEYWIMLLRKIIPNLETGKRACFFKASWNCLAEPHPPGIIWFSRDVYLCLTPSSLLSYFNNGMGKHP